MVRAHNTLGESELPTHCAPVRLWAPNVRIGWSASDEQLNTGGAMSEENKATLKQANAAIAEGDTERFLSFCTEDTEWTFVGEQTLRGKAAVREYIAKTYGK